MTAQKLMAIIASAYNVSPARKAGDTPMRPMDVMCRLTIREAHALVVEYLPYSRDSRNDCLHTPTEVAEAATTLASMM